MLSGSACAKAVRKHADGIDPSFQRLFSLRAQKLFKKIGKNGNSQEEGALDLSGNES